MCTKLSKLYKLIKPKTNIYTVFCNNNNNNNTHLHNNNGINLF